MAQKLGNGSARGGRPVVYYAEIHVGFSLRESGQVETGVAREHVHAAHSVFAGVVVSFPLSVFTETANGVCGNADVRSPNVSRADDVEIPGAPLVPSQRGALVCELAVHETLERGRASPMPGL